MSTIMLQTFSRLQQLQHCFLLLQQGPLDPSEIRLVLRFQYNDYYPVVVLKQNQIVARNEVFKRLKKTIVSTRLAHLKSKFRC